MTKLNYLDDTYLFESVANFINVRHNEKGEAVILDQTIFYPQGGGQPADHGEIIKGENIFIVKDVRLDEYGVVYHFGEFKNGSFNLDDKVILKIDKDRRILNAKLHSAGHLIDCAILNLNLNIKAEKGYHFSDGPYVECDGILENVEQAIFLLQNEINGLLKKDLKVEVKNLNQNEAEDMGLLAPAGKSVRIVGFESQKPCGCGGTHIKSASEIKNIFIRKIK